MKVDKEKKRLKAIKLKYVLVPTKCDCCEEKYKREKMWQFNRWGLNKTIHKWHYCQNCMHSAEEVLNEVDTDEYHLGLAGIDDPIHFLKKDYTRINLALEKSFGTNTL